MPGLGVLGAGAVQDKVPGGQGAASVAWICAVLAGCLLALPQSSAGESVRFAYFKSLFY